VGVNTARPRKGQKALKYPPHLHKTAEEIARHRLEIRGRKTGGEGRMLPNQWKPQRAKEALRNPSRRGKKKNPQKTAHRSKQFRQSPAKTAKRKKERVGEKTSALSAESKKVTEGETSVIEKVPGNGGRGKHVP